MSYLVDKKVVEMINAMGEKEVAVFGVEQGVIKNDE